MTDHSPPPPHVYGLPAVMLSGAGSRSGWAYTTALGEFIADMYVETPGGLWGVASAFPDRVPPPAVVRAWCRQYPAFGLLMREAERLRAERMMEEAVLLADTGEGSPARLALQLNMRTGMAERLDRARWGRSTDGTAGEGPASVGQGQLTAQDVSDDTLAALALAGQAGEGAGG